MFAVAMFVTVRRFHLLAQRLVETSGPVKHVSGGGGTVMSESESESEGGWWCGRVVVSRGGRGGMVWVGWYPIFVACDVSHMSSGWLKLLAP